MSYDLRDALIGVEQDVRLQDLMDEAERQRLLTLTRDLLQTDVALLDSQGAVLAGEPISAGEKAPLVLEMEPVAYLTAHCDAALLNSAAAIWQWGLAQGFKYRMASDLHTRIVTDDYQELQLRNRKLVASEARYKDLAEHLEQRVKQQVKTIEAAQRQLYEKEKLASVGHLAAGVAHEINNPIGFVHSNLGIANDYVHKLKAYIRALKTGEDPDHLLSQEAEFKFIFEDFRDLLEESQDGCKRVTRIVKSLKDFSNVDATEKTRCSLNRLIENVCELHSGRIPEQIEVIRKLAPLPEIDLNAGHFGQVLYNLMSNALDALKANSERSGRISFVTAIEGDDLVVRVSDNGSGMPTEVLNQVFVPFYTTKPVGQGTGLGLTVCRDIVQAHGGEIQVKSQPGLGTQVTIRLPGDGGASRLSGSPDTPGLDATP